MSFQEAAYPSLTSRLYSSGQVLLTSFIGGPLGGALLLRSNYRALNDSGAGSRALMWSVAATVLLGFVVQLLPADFPNSVIPACYAGVMHQVAERFQGGQYRAHVGAGGSKQSWLRAVVLGVIALVGTLALLLASGFALLMVLP